MKTVIPDETRQGMEENMEEKVSYLSEKFLIYRYKTLKSKSR